MLVTSTVILAVTSNPFVTPRFWMGSVALATVTVLIATSRRPARRAATGGILILLILLVFPMADYFRRPDASPIPSPTEIRDEWTSSGDFSMSPGVGVARI